MAPALASNLLGRDDVDVHLALAALGLDAVQQRDALLAFLHTGALTDWEVLREVRPIAEGKATGHDS